MENSAHRRLAVIDSDGFRPNVGIIVANGHGQVLWARRVGQDSWQFPQGGIKADETPEQALYRELAEELGLTPGHVELVGCTRGWLRYTLPRRFVRRNTHQVCIGQKQVWFLLRLLASEHDVCLDATGAPEFDHWKWVGYWRPAKEVIYFKREVYRRALKELAPLHCGVAPERTARSD
jgi:putative (di)nucleoside polyphosphate hydrolase